MFYNCNNLTNVNIETEDISILSSLNINNTFTQNLYFKSTGISTLYNVFFNYANLKNVKLDIPNVTNMGYTFKNCTNLVNAPVIPNSVIDMRATFSDCSNLVNAPVIPNSVTNMANAFYGCSNLKNATNIPDSVTDMANIYWRCYNLVNAPVIGNSVTTMSNSFYNCRNLVNAPDLTNCTNLTSLYRTFQSCYNLVNAPVIPNSVTNMASTFTECLNLTGDINILSTQVINAYQCFYNTSLTKNVYISCIYENGVNTQTYNSFISAGYSINERIDGVKLFDPNGSYINFNITPDENTLKYLNGRLVENNRQMTLSDNEYVLYNRNYPVIIGHIEQLEPNEEYTLTKDLTSVTGYTITLNVDQTDCDVTFDINGVKIPAVVNSNNYSITLNTDEEISIGYVVKKSGYKKVIDSVIFNNSDITENITMIYDPWVDWTRPNLTANGTLGGDSFAVSATRYSTRYAYYAVDSSTSTYWRPSSTGTVEYTLYNPNLLKITQMVFTYTGTSYRASTVTVQGSNDNTNWETVTSSYSGTTTGTLDMSSNTKGYKYYKLSLVTYSSAIRMSNMEITAQEAL